MRPAGRLREGRALQSGGWRIARRQPHEAGAVRHQVRNGHLPHGRDPIKAVGRAFARNSDLQIRELRQELLDRVGQAQQAALHQLQGRDSGDRLGHGLQLEQVVHAHRALRFQIGQAMGFERYQLSAARHQRDGTGDLVLELHAGDEGIDAGQALAGHAHLLGRGSGKGGVTVAVEHAVVSSALPRTSGTQRAGRQRCGTRSSPAVPRSLGASLVHDSSRLWCGAV